MNKSTYIIVATIVVLLAAVGNIFWNKWEEEEIFKNPLSPENSDMKSLEIEKYFVVQKVFKSLVQSVSFTNLQRSNVASFPEDAEKLDFLGIQPNKWITDSDLYEWIFSNSYNGFVIVPLEKVDYRLKTIKVDGILFWDPTADISKYPLRWTEEITITKDKEKFDNRSYDASRITTFIAGGEVIPARAVARKFRRVEDYTYPFVDVRDEFKKADISSLILENAISGRPEPCHGCTWFIGDEDFIEGLTYLKIDVVSLAGNHMGDGGEAAVERTIELLDTNNIRHCGASGDNLEAASKPARVVRGELTISFLCYDDIAYYHWASEQHWGTSTYSQRNADGTKSLLAQKIQEDVDNARKNSDIIVILVSWGDQEYVNYPLDYQLEAGHAFIDAGADIIIASHQHWVNALEIYKEKPIFYGLGNFVFDQTHTDPTRQGIFVKFYFYDDRLVNMEVIPHESCGPQQSAIDDKNCPYFVPRILSEEDEAYSEIMERMYQYSEI